MTVEYEGFISTFEAKNTFQNDCAVYQIYLPFLYYTEMKKRDNLAINDINCCYLWRQKIRGGLKIRIYQYIFTDPYAMSSIRLLKSAEYTINKNMSLHHKCNRLGLDWIIKSNPAALNKRYPNV